MTRYRLLPERSELRMEARSNLHPIHGEARGLEGEVEVRLDDDGRLDLAVLPRAHIEFPTRRLTSGNPLQDMELHRRLEVRKFATVTADLREVKPRAEGDRYRTFGDLTFHGVTRRVPADVRVTLEAGGKTMLVEGECILDVRGFGVTPPRVLGLQVYPEIKVRLRLAAERRE